MTDVINKGGGSMNGEQGGGETSVDPGQERLDVLRKGLERHYPTVGSMNRKPGAEQPARQQGEQRPGVTTPGNEQQPTTVTGLPMPDSQQR